MSQRPYPGLRAFWRDEIDIFFGRERQIDEILEKLQHSHFLAVLGPSGCGKSSLVRTGVLSALDSGFMCKAGANWLVADMKPGSSPFLALAKALLNDRLFAEHYQRWFPAHSESGSDQWKDEAQYFLQASLQRGPQSMHELLNDLALPEGSAILLLVDQFEEIFRYRRHASNEAGEFVNLMLSACHHPQVYTSITMRSEFLGNCVAFHGLPEAINQGLYLTPSLDRDQLADAITFPARVFDGSVAPELINRLLNDAGQAMDQLPLLQHALMRLWEHDEDKVLTLEEYEATGGLQRMLNDHLEEAWDELDESQQALAGQLFRLLTEKTPEGHSIRRPVTFGEALNLPNATRENMLEMINVFRRSGRHFLMPPLSVELKDNTVIDITHESLIRQWKRLNDWVDAEAEHGLLYQRLENTALRYQQGEAALLSSPELEIALHWRETEKPSANWSQRYGDNFQSVMVFLEKSVQAKRTAEEQKQEQLRAKSRRALMTTLLGFVIAVGAAVFGWMAAISNEKKVAEAKVRVQESVDQVRQAEALVEEKSEQVIKAQAVAEETKQALNQESVIQQDLERKYEDLRYLAEAVEIKSKAIESYGSTAADVEEGRQSVYDKTLYESLIIQARLFMQNERYPEARKALLDAEIWRDKSADYLDYQLKLMQRKLEISGLSPSLWYEKVNTPLYSAAIDTKRNALISVGEDGWIFINKQGEMALKYRLQVTTPEGRRMPVDTETIQDIAVSPSGDGFATVDDAGQIILWQWPNEEHGRGSGNPDLLAKEPVFYLSQKLEGVKRAKAITYSPDGQYLAVGYVGNPGMVSLWKLEPGYLSLVWTGKEHSSQISEGGLSFASQDVLASASHDGSVRFWALDSDDQAVSILQPLRHPTSVLGMSFSKDRKLLATAAGKQVFIWDWQQGKLLHSFFTEHQGVLFSLQWVEDQFGIERLVTAGQDKTMRFWKVSAKEKYQVLLAVFNGHEAEVAVSRLAYDQNRRQLYSPGKDGSLLQWRTNLPWTQLIPIAQGSPESTALSADGSLLAVGLNDGIMQLYRTGTPLPIIEKQVGTGPVEELLFNPKTQQLVALTQERHLGWKLSFWRYSELTGLSAEGSVEGQMNWIQGMTFNPSGTHLYSAAANSTVALVDMNNIDAGILYSKVLHTQLLDNSAELQPAPLLSVSISEDSRYLLATSKRQISNWRLADNGLPDGEVLSKIETGYALHEAIFAPDYSYLVAIGHGGRVNRYALDGSDILKEEIYSLNSRTQTVINGKFIPQANVLMTIGNTVDDAVELQAFDMSANQLLFNLKTPSYSGNGISGLNFSQQCTDTGCRFSVPLKSKGSEKRQVAAYDFSFRERD